MRTVVVFCRPGTAAADLGAICGIIERLDVGVTFDGYWGSSGGIKQRQSPLGIQPPFYFYYC